jgi:hypothetical protein
MLALAFLSVVLASCVCQNLSVADGCTASSGPYTDCQYWQAWVNCNASTCASTKTAHAYSCNLLCECAPLCPADLIADNVCQSQCKKPECNNDGGDCDSISTTLAYPGCTSDDIYALETCLNNRPRTANVCTDSNNVLDCYRISSCLVDVFSQYCQGYEQSYSGCEYNCTVPEASANNLIVASFALLIL